MTSIEFLELSDVLEIHADQVFHYGGTVELRDAALLESAIEQPRATFGGQFLHAFPFDMAAAYLFHIVNIAQQSYLLVTEDDFAKAAGVQKVMAE